MNSLEEVICLGEAKSSTWFRAILLFAIAGVFSGCVACDPEDCFETKTVISQLSEITPRLQKDFSNGKPVAANLETALEQEVPISLRSGGTIVKDVPGSMAQYLLQIDNLQDVGLSYGAATDNDMEPTLYFGFPTMWGSIGCGWSASRPAWECNRF